MTHTEQEIAQNLRDAGCGRKEIETILGCWRQGDLHESQKYIDRLDYLSYRLQHE